MAIAFVKDATAASDTVTVPAGGFAAGSLVVMGGIWDDTSSTVSAINDTAGNTYAAAQTIVGNGITITIWYSVLANALSAGNTIVATLAGNNGVWVAAEFSGIGDSPLDQAPTGTTDTAVINHTSGTTGTTAVADELLIGLHGTPANATYTATGSFIINEQTNPFGFAMSMQYRIVAATGTYASTCDTDSNKSCNNLIATFKGSVSAPTGVSNRYLTRHSRMTSW